MTADTIRSFVQINLFTDDKLQLEEASYSNSRRVEKIHFQPLDIQDSQIWS